MRLYDPPSALFPKGSKYSVELAGAKILLAMDEEKEFHNIGDIFTELSRGDFWRGQENIRIADEIEKINILNEDAEALYDPNVLAIRVITALELIQKRGLLFFGVASFEGNAFETLVFDEVELDPDDQDKLLNLYKAKRKSGYPDLMPGEGSDAFTEINFFGAASNYFTIPNKRELHDLAAILYPYEGYASGIVTVAQGAANFILLTDNIFKTKNHSEIHIDRRNLNQMFKLINMGVLAAPISWFKIDLGLKGLEALDGWEKIKDRPEIIDAVSIYQKYLRNLIIAREKNSVEKMLEEDLGTYIQDISSMSDEEIEEDHDKCMGALNRLNELDEEDKAVSLLHDPPKILFAHGKNKKKVAIGGAMSLLAVDVGTNLCCIADLRENVSWGEYILGETPEELDESAFYNIQEDQSFLELENPTELRDIYGKAFQQIMQGSEAFLGVLELESNGFDFSLFRELDIEGEDLQKICDYYRSKIKTGKYPKLQNGFIKVKWRGRGKEYFSFTDEFPSILDIIEKINTGDAYQDKFATGIVATTEESTIFYILANNYSPKHSEMTESSKIDHETLSALFEACENTNLAPLCWFKITLGMKTLRNHPYWKQAIQYDTLRIILENYQRYTQELVRIKKTENEYRIY